MLFGDTRLPERFWSKVAVNDGTHCWEWTAAKDGKGYGKYYVGGGRVLATAHRFAFLTLVGESNSTLDADHLCRNRACVNPAHIEMVTRQVNTVRGDGPAAVNYAKTHCHLGHPLEGENLKIGQRNDHARRSCRTCLREAYRRADIKRGKRRA